MGGPQGSCSSHPLGLAQPAPTRLRASCFSAFLGPQTRPSDLALPGVMRLERKDLFHLFNIKK